MQIVFKYLDQGLTLRSQCEGHIKFIYYNYLEPNFIVGFVPLSINCVQFRNALESMKS